MLVEYYLTKKFLAQMAAYSNSTKGEPIGLGKFTCHI